nr:NAD(P)-binding domain-containing protein [Amycolatopsis sp. MtRt-6]
MSTTEPGDPVTVIGLGPMGQAISRILHDAGHPVTVWNRTAARADALVEAGATRAPDPASALAAAELVLLSLTEYQAMYDILGDATSALAGRTLVNISSDTPDRTAEAAEWATRHGARFVAGGIMVPPPMLGTGAAYAYYSGDRTAFTRWEHVLRLIGAPRYLGEDPRLAQLLYLANLDVFLATTASLLHAAALARAFGVPAEAVVPDLVEHIGTIPAILGSATDFAAQLDNGTFGDPRSVIMMGATADHVAIATAAAGVHPGLPAAVKELYDAAIAGGHGSVFEVMKAD